MDGDLFGDVTPSSPHNCCLMSSSHWLTLLGIVQATLGVTCLLSFSMFFDVSGDPNYSRIHLRSIVQYEMTSQLV